MKFGVNIPITPRPDARHPYDHVFEYCARVEELGYDFVVLGHHRFTPGFPLHPWVTLGAIAARTETLRLGTSIALLPLDHPLDMAEEIATVDQLSNGRVSSERGSATARTSTTRSISTSTRAVAACRSASRSCSERGPRTRSRSTGNSSTSTTSRVYPKPVQQPRPTIWIGANSDAAVRRAARLTDGWMVGFGDRLPTAVERIATFRDESRAHNRRGGDLSHATGRDRRDAASRSRRRGCPTCWPRSAATPRAGAPQDRNDDVRKVARSERPSLEGLGNDLFVAGTPDDVIRGLQRAAT